jgi:hypothetical protein
MAFLAFPFLPALRGGGAFLTPASDLVAFGVAVLDVAGAMLVKMKRLYLDGEAWGWIRYLKQNCDGKSYGAVMS